MLTNNTVRAVTSAPVDRCSSRREPVGLSSVGGPGVCQSRSAVLKLITFVQLMPDWCDWLQSVSCDESYWGAAGTRTVHLQKKGGCTEHTQRARGLFSFLMKINSSTWMWLNYGELLVARTTATEPDQRLIAPHPPSTPPWRVPHSGRLHMSSTWRLFGLFWLCCSRKLKLTGFSSKPPLELESLPSDGRGSPRNTRSCSVSRAL